MIELEGPYLIYENYLKVCRDAANDDKVFKFFKSHPDYKLVLEHVSPSEGLDYLTDIGTKFPYLLQHINKFATNDSVGGPSLSPFKEVGLSMSPTTLRYVKVLADLMDLFGRLDFMDIIEIGGGYGGQCKIINDIATFNSYTIVDLPDALALTGKYLKHFNVDNVILRSVDNMSEIHYDLCISNYAFAEIQRYYQNIYAEKIIKNSDRGYMTCNIFGGGNPSDPMSREDIFALKENYTIVPEKPLTAVNNFIYTWG